MRHDASVDAMTSALRDDIGMLARAVSWSLGDLRAAEIAFRDAVAMHRKSGSRGKHPLGYSLANLAGVLTERGQLVAAIEAAREGF